MYWPAVTIKPIRNDDDLKRVFRRLEKICQGRGGGHYLTGLRVYCAVGESATNEVPPPPSPRKYWTRRGIARWLATRLAEDVPTIVSIDHGFSFPLRYFEVHQLAPNRPAFL
jgi:hypothetical protein